MVNARAVVRPTSSRETRGFIWGKGTYLLRLVLQPTIVTMKVTFVLTVATMRITSKTKANYNQSRRNGPKYHSRQHCVWELHSSLILSENKMVRKSIFVGKVEPGTVKLAFPPVRCTSVWWGIIFHQRNRSAWKVYCQNGRRMSCT